MTLYLSTSSNFRDWQDLPHEAKVGAKMATYAKGMGGFVLSLPVRVSLVAWKALLFTFSLLRAVGSLLAGDRIKRWTECGQRAKILGGALAEVFTGVLGILLPILAYKLDMKLHQAVFPNAQAESEGATFTTLETTAVVAESAIPVPTESFQREEEPQERYVPPLKRERAERERREIPQFTEANINQFFENLLSSFGLSDAPGGAINDNFVRDATLRGLDAFYAELQHLDAANADTRVADAALYMGDFAAMECAMILQFLLDQDAHRGALSPAQQQLVDFLQPLAARFDAVKHRGAAHLMRACVAQWLGGPNPGDDVGHFAHAISQLQMDCFTNHRDAWRRLWMAGVQQWQQAHPQLFSDDA